MGIPSAGREQITQSRHLCCRYNSVNGCDSVYTLHLKVDPVYSFTENRSICDGDTCNWQGTDYTATTLILPLQQR